MTGVGFVSELPERFQYRGAGVAADAGLIVQHPGNGGLRHACLEGHVGHVNRIAVAPDRHFVLFSCKLFPYIMDRMKEKSKGCFE